MKAVILAGGEGRRLHPHTLTTPKPMMPIGDRPILEHLVGQLRRYGISDLILATGHFDEIIRRHFGDGRDFGVSIRYSREDRALGTAGPLGLLRTALERTFLLLNGDIFADLDLGAIIADHRHRASDATVVLARHGETFEFGVVSLDERGDVTTWDEKPVVERLVSAGACVMEPATLAHLEPSAHAELPELVMALVRARLRVRGYVHPGYWYDIGRPADYERACAAARVAQQ